MPRTVVAFNVQKGLDMTRPALLASVANFPCGHKPIHQQMIDRCPEISAKKPSDAQFALACVHMVNAIPEKRYPRTECGVLTSSG